MNKKVRKSNVFATHEIKAVVKEGELLMNFSYGTAKADDGEGNEVQIFIWINGDWKIDYKGREFVISLDDNVNALIDAIKEGRV